MIASLEKKHRRIVPLALSLFCAFGMTLSLNLYSVSKDHVFFESANGFTRWITDIYHSLNNNRVENLMIVIGLFFVFRLALGVEMSRRGKVLSALMAAFLSFGQLIGYSFSKTDSWQLFLGTKKAMFKAGIWFLAYFILFYMLVLLVLHIIDKYGNNENADGALEWDRRQFLKTAVFILLAWLPYYFIFFPTVSNNDTGYMIMQYFGKPTYLMNLSSVRGEEIFMTNHHPVFLTFIYGSFTRLGQLLGNVSAGWGLYALIQMTVMALCVSLGLMYFTRWGVSQKIVKYIKWFFAFFPPLAIWSISMLKDTSYSICMLAFTLLLIEVVKTRGMALRSVRFSLLLLLATLLVMLTKNQGIYIVAILLIVFLVAFRSRWYNILAVFGSGVLLFTVYTNLLIPAMTIAPGGVQEALSVPFQQTARFVKYYGDEVTEHEKAVINRVLPYDRLAQLYNPQLADPVKQKYNQDATREDLFEYFKVWFGQFLRHPGTYIQATLNNTYGFYSTYRSGGMAYYQLATKAIEEHPEIQGSNIGAFQGARDFIQAMIQTLQKIPALGLLFSSGTITWFILLCGIVLIYQKRGRWLLAFLPAFLTIAVCLVSPSNGNHRYVMPLFYILPFMIATIFTKKEDIQNGQDRGADSLLQRESDD